jgi:hypothetical protein
VGKHTAHGYAPNYIAEYTPTGKLVQTLASLTSYDNIRFGDLVIGADKTIYTVLGGQVPELVRIDPDTLGMSRQTIPGWRGYTSGIEKYQDYLFLSNAESLARPRDGGVIRFDTRGGPTIRFGERTSKDVTLGQDGKLYSLTNISLVEIFDPNTGSQLGVFDAPVIGSTYSAIAVNAKGEMYLGLG